MSLVPDGDTIWAGTYGNGIYRVDNCMSEKPDITVYSDSDGLADNQVNGLLLDGVYLWIATENGLSRLDTQTGEINSYDMDDGLKSMSFCENSISRGSNGTIYMGLKGGGLSILRSSYVSNEYSNKPEVVISGYYSKDEFHNVSLSDAISKDERDTDFTLKFSDLSYRKGADITYESRLLPMEKDWSPVFENDTHVKFGHIPGGNYRIQIRAVDRKGNVLSQDEKMLYVKPVLYKRWWFYLIALLLVGLLVNLFVRWYTRSINRKKDLLQQEVDRQTKELKEQKEELEKRAKELAEQNALLQKQNELIASHNTLSSSIPSNKESDFSFKLLAAIQKKYKDPDLDVYGLADAMGMSRSQLNEKIQQALGQSAGFLAEDKVAAVGIVGVGVAVQRLGRKKEIFSALGLFEKIVEIFVICNVQKMPVVEPRALQVPVVERKAERLYKMQPRARRGAGSRDVARVRGDFGLYKHNI